MNNKEIAQDLLQQLDDMEETCGEMASYEIVAEQNGFEDSVDLMEFLATNS